MDNTTTRISIIIPTLNEAEHIGTLLQHLNIVGHKEIQKEILVVDGGSLDNTKAIIKTYNIIPLESEKGRAKQMNFGAKNASGEILYFLHADTLPPRNFDRFIEKAVSQGYEAGCFRMKFDTKNPFLRFFAWLSRINHTLCRGGDQSLFVTKEQFEALGGFNENYLIYEDSEFIRRLYKTLKFKVLPHSVITSARKYREKGWLNVQYHFGMIHLKNYLGASPKELYRYYHDKILT